MTPKSMSGRASTRRFHRRAASMRESPGIRRSARGEKQGTRVRDGTAGLRQTRVRRGPDLAGTGGGVIEAKSGQVAEWSSGKVNEVAAYGIRDSAFGVSLGIGHQELTKPGKRGRGGRSVAATSSTQGADGHFGAHRRGDKRSLTTRRGRRGSGGNTGREAGCARGGIAPRFFSEIRKVATKTDTLVRTNAVISGD